MKNSDMLFTLLRQAINGEPVGELSPTGVDLSCRIAAEHDLLHLLGGVSDGSHREEILRAQWQAMYRAERISYELGRLCEELEAAGVPYIPLKGAVLRELYPEPWMRTSCDIDILVHEEDLDRISELFTNTISVRMSRKGTHDKGFFTESGLHVELHHTLVEKDLVKNAATVLSRVWDVAQPVEGYTWQYRMPDELFYFYHIAHAAKHILRGGCGIRFYLDMWVMRHRVSYDEAARQALIEEGELSAFHAASVRLSEAWFSARPYDEVTKQLEEYILLGGTYGSLSNKLLIQRAAMGGRWQYIRARIFAPYETLCTYYPYIRGRRWLIPYAQVRRWLHLLRPKVLMHSLRELRHSHRLEKDSRVPEAENLLEQLDL